MHVGSLHRSAFRPVLNRNQKRAVTDSGTSPHDFRFPPFRCGLAWTKTATRHGVQAGRPDPGTTGPRSDERGSTGEGDSRPKGRRQLRNGHRSRLRKGLIEDQTPGYGTR